MNVSRRKAVSPIIATLLLIAITVAAGIIVYVFVNSLSGSLTKSGGNQVTESLSLDAYTSYISGSNGTYSFTIVVRNTGGAPVTISSVYFNGAPLTQQKSGTLTVGVQQTQTLILAPSFTSGPTNSPREFSGVPTTSAGSSNQIKVITTDGGTFTFNVIAGGSS